MWKAAHMAVHMDRRVVCHHESWALQTVKSQALQRILGLLIARW